MTETSAAPVTLLPDNATPLMTAVALTNAERRPFAPGPIATLWDPMAAPAAVLPYLAAANGLSIWRTDWSEDKKRRVIARTIALKRRRGTVPCFEAHLAFVDAGLAQVIAPPQIAVARQSLTVEGRAAWLAQFAELRVYRYRNRSRQVGVFAPRLWLAARLTLRDSSATAHAGLRAVVVDRGVERSAVVQVTAGAAEFAQTVQIARPTLGRRMVPGGALARPLSFPLASDAGERLYTFRTAASGPDTLRPGLGLVDAAPVHVASRTSGLKLVTAGKPLAGPHRFLRASSAREGVYDSLRLFDPARARAGHVRARGGWTLGFSRLGQPAFQLELAVDLTFRRRRGRRFPHMPGFVETHDPTRTTEALTAVRAAKLGRDKILVRTALHRRIRAGDGIPLDGSHRLGQIIRSL